MNKQTSTDNKVIFAKVRDLAKYLDVSERRLRQYKEAGRLNYTTDAVLVDRVELSAIKQAIAAWAAPYVPHRFRAIGSRNKKALGRFSRYGKTGHRDAELRSLDKPAEPPLENSTPPGRGCDEPLNRADERIQGLMRDYGLSLEEALEVLREE